MAAPMRRNHQVVRQWRLILELDGPKGLTLQQMAAMTGACTRTIRRDLEALQDAGFPLVVVEEGRGLASRWRVFDWRKEAA